MTEDSSSILFYCIHCGFSGLMPEKSASYQFFKEAFP
mgnify:CR=1 FL=1